MTESYWASRLSRAWLYALGLGLTLVWTVPSTADACTCAPAHLPTIYNQSSDVFVGRIIKSKKIGSQIHYLAKIRKDYKGCKKKGQTVRLITADNSAACGINLTIGGNYLVTGNKGGALATAANTVWINSCGYTRPVKTLTSADKEFLGSRQLCCGGSCECADGSIPVLCFADPCSVTTCPQGECTANYCGGCNAEFADEFGNSVCEPCSNTSECPWGQTCSSAGQCVFGCSDDSDCGDDFWCSPTMDPSLNECRPYQQEGEFCGGFVPVWAQNKCAPGLVCTDYPPFILDAPGICRKPCDANGDCSSDQYCAPDGFCRDDGTCKMASDCEATGNDWPHIECVGYPTCNSSMECGWICGEPDPCQDLSDVDFGFCLAVLGVGIIDGECTTISGCGDMGYPLFESMEKCNAECAPPEPCDDLADVDFGACLAVLGVGVVDGECTTISGCSDMGYPLFDSFDKCQSECIEPEPCDDLSGVDFGPCGAILGIGVVDGECTFISGCSAMGYPLFDSFDKCEEECEPKPCEDLSGVDFGPCDAILGIGIVDGDCTWISGCDAMGYPLFSSFDECQKNCGDSDLQWYATCGDPVCSGWKDKGLPKCTDEEIGNPCANPGQMCDPMNFCNSVLVCTDTDPTSFGCPISRASKKTEIRYLSSTQRNELAGQLLDFPLATWKYKAQGMQAPERLGFIIEDVEQTPAVDRHRDMVDLYGYMTMAVAALQAQNEQIDVLNQRIEELESQLQNNDSAASPVECLQKKQSLLGCLGPL